jgi:hypothetical protein
MKPITNVYVITATDDNGLATSQTPADPGLLVLDGVLATSVIPSQQHVTIYCAGNDAGRTFTITGYDARGKVITEALAGKDVNTSTSVLSYVYVSSIAVDAATDGAVIAGYVATAEFPWIPLNHYANPFQYSYSVDIGTATFKVEGCLEDIQDDSVTKIPFDVQASGSSDVSGNKTGILSAVRIKLTAFTSGDIQFTVQQAGT